MSCAARFSFGFVFSPGDDRSYTGTPGQTPCNSIVNQPIGGETLNWQSGGAHGGGAAGPAARLRISPEHLRRWIVPDLGPPGMYGPRRPRKVSNSGDLSTRALRPLPSTFRPRSAALRGLFLRSMFSVGRGHQADLRWWDGITRTRRRLGIPIPNCSREQTLGPRDALVGLATC